MFLTRSVFVLFLRLYCVFSANVPDKEYKLNIVHYNDFHARYEETSVKDAVCRSNNGSCLGGFARLYAHIRTLLAEKPDALLLNAGDTFQGTYWHTLLKWQIAQEFMNLLPHDAHAIGNHEFDDGPSGLVPYLKALKAPVLAANMDTTDEPTFAGTYKPSIVVERHGRKIGIIGLITPDTVTFSSPGKVKFSDPGEATKREAEVLTKQGVDIIILLSHCGLPVDKMLARDYGQYIDIIIGGHTHTLLWNGEAPSGERVVDTYPVFIENAADRNHKVLIVQASSFTKYMGNLTVYFDSRGDYIRWEGGPIFLDRSIPEDPAIKKALEPYAKLVHEAASQPVGRTLHEMDAKQCATGECTLGNLLTDAMVEYAKEKVNASNVYIAFLRYGNIRGKKFSEGTITQENLFDMYPFLYWIMYFELKGVHLKRVLEQAVVDATSLDPFEVPWLHQLSGLKVTYNISKSEGQRVSSVYVGDDISLQKLDDEKYYHVLSSKFVLHHGKGFPQVKEFVRNLQEIGRDHDTLEAYIKKHSPLNVATSGRIVFSN